MDLFVVYQFLIIISMSVSSALTARVSAYKGVSQPMRFLGGLFLANIIYSFSYLLELHAKSSEWAHVFVGFEYFGVMCIALFWMLIALSFHPKRFTNVKIDRKVLKILFILPFLTSILIWTNPFHHQIYAEISLIELYPVSLFMFDRVWGFWVLNGIMIVMYFIGVFRLLFAVLQDRVHLRSRYPFLILISIIPAVSYAGLLLKKVFYNLDTMPISFALTGVVLYWGVKKLQLFYLLPTAHEMVVESMSDAMVMVDPGNRLIESNPRGRELFFSEDPDPIGKSLLELNPDLARHIAHASNKRVVTLKVNGESRSFNISKSEILGKKGAVLGSFFVFHDITELREAMKALEIRATSDGLTGLVNHRHFMTLAAEEAARLEHAPKGVFSLIMFDLDFFKAVNDTYGHSVGDQVLVHVSNLLVRNVRNLDVCARYGGEEFVLLLRGTGIEDAQKKAETLRKLIATTPVVCDSEGISITSSFGVSEYRPSMGIRWEQALNHADTALYQAKEEGRNRVCRYAGNVSSRK